MDPLFDGGGGKQNGRQKMNTLEDTNTVRNKKTSAFYLTGGGPLTSCVNYDTASKAKIRKSKSDHGGTASGGVGLVTSESNFHDVDHKTPQGTSSGGTSSKPGRSTNVGQSHSFNYHHRQCFNRQAKKSAVGLGLANINQQLLSATMFGVVLGGDSKASQQVFSKNCIH